MKEAHKIGIGRAVITQSCLSLNSGTSCVGYASFYWTPLI